eukprot:COSAG04_NODE_929_length_9364_cov_4.141932_1_plen_677_part_10
MPATQNPLAIELGEIELQEAGPFPLTLKDMFTNSYVVDAHPEMTIREVKEAVRVEKELRLVRAEKQREAEAVLAVARESLAQLEAEVARAVGDAKQLAALEEQEAVAVAEIARLEARAREVVESAEVVAQRMHDVKQGRTRLELSVGTMGLRTFRGGTPVETLLYQDMQGWEVAGDALSIDLQDGTQKVFATSEAGDIADKMTEHAKALGAAKKAQLRAARRAAPGAVEVSDLARFLDAAVLLFDGQPLDDDSTVGSHGLSRTTTVTLSSQDARKGRERREERAERERRERKKREARKLLAKRMATATACVLLVTTGVYFTKGCGGSDLDCGANGHCVGLASAACVCEGNFIGELCDTECGCLGHGNQTAIEAARAAGSCAAGSCACEGNFIGEFCETECGCSGHGNQTAIEAAREAGSCAAGACACEGNLVGTFCETDCGCSGHGNQTAIRAAREANSCSAGSCTCEGNFIGEFCETECPIPDCGAHGTFDVGSIEAAREANSCSALSCTCEGNWAGQFCQASCGDHGTSDGSDCACEGNFIGEFCETECPIPDCGPHGTFEAGSIEAAREANSCSALGSCACDGNYAGELCKCRTTSNTVVYNGAAYRTLDDAPPELPRDGAPNTGCQRNQHGWNGRSYDTDEPNYLPLPPGYALAPPDADTIAVIAAHGWSTSC